MRVTGRTLKILDGVVDDEVDELVEALEHAAHCVVCVCVCVCVHEHGMLGLTFAAARELDPHCVGVS